MNCRAFANVLDLFEENRLSPRRAAQARAHLDSCASCRALVSPAAARAPSRAPQALKDRLILAARASAASTSAKGPAVPALWPSEAPTIALAAFALVLVGLMIAASGVPSQWAGAALASAAEEP